MENVYKYYETAASEDSYRGCVVTVSHNNCYYIRGLELIKPENHIDLKYIKIWNVILLLTYWIYCENFYY